MDWEGGVETDFTNLCPGVGVSQVRRTDRASKGQREHCGPRHGGVKDKSVSRGQALYVVLLVEWKM